METGGRILVPERTRMARIEDLVQQLASNDIPHIQARLAGLETQGRITIALVLGLIIAVVAGAVSVLTVRLPSP